MDRSSFAKNTAFQYALQVAKYAFPLLTIPYLTRVFGPDVYAIRAYVLAFMTFTQIFLDYGFFTYGTRAVVQAHSNQETISKITSAICVWRALLCVLGLFVLSFVLPLVPILAQNALYVYIAYVCVCFKAMLPDFVFAGLQDMSIITYRFVASQAVATVLIFLVVQSSRDLIWAATIKMIALTASFILVAIISYLRVKACPLSARLCEHRYKTPVEAIQSTLLHRHHAYCPPNLEQQALAFRGQNLLQF